MVEEMRKVKFKNHKDQTQYGIFLGWGMGDEETVAIIENPDGTVVLHDAHLIQFLKPSVIPEDKIDNKPSFIETDKDLCPIVKRTKLAINGDINWKYAVQDLERYNYISLCENKPTKTDDYWLFDGNFRTTKRVCHPLKSGLIYRIID